VGLEGSLTTFTTKKYDSLEAYTSVKQIYASYLGLPHILCILYIFIVLPLVLTWVSLFVITKTMFENIL
jgi:fluoride ion exporter CrcB/FEX